MILPPSGKLARAPGWRWRNVTFRSLGKPTSTTAYGQVPAISGWSISSQLELNFENFLSFLFSSSSHIHSPLKNSKEYPWAAAEITLHYNPPVSLSACWLDLTQSCFFGSLQNAEPFVTVHVCFLYHGMAFCDGVIFNFFFFLKKSHVLFRILNSGVRSTPRPTLTLTSWRSNLIPGNFSPDRPSTLRC